MPPQAVICELCGGKFFAHSIGHHKKICRSRVGKQMHDCPYCGGGVPLLEMDAHILRCERARSMGAKPTGASAALARKLERDANPRTAPAIGSATSREFTFGSSTGAALPEYSDNGDARVDCKICGRKFAMDRIGKHQAICQRIHSKGPRKTFEVERSYCEGGSRGRVISVASRPASGKLRNGASGPQQTHWREQSNALRDACRGARAHKMPGLKAAQNSTTMSGTISAKSQPQAKAYGRRPQATDQNELAEQTWAEEDLEEAMCIPASQIKEGFRKLDTNGDGSLDLLELSKFVKLTTPNLSDTQISGLFDSIDKDHNGRVDFEEFVDYIFSDPRAAFGYALGNAISASACPGPAASATRPSSALRARRYNKAAESPYVSATTCLSGRKDEPPLPVGSAVCVARHKLGQEARSKAAARPVSAAVKRSQPILHDVELPPWGSPDAPSKYGRHCITAPPARTTPHNTPWGGCESVAPREKGGAQSNTPSYGNPVIPGRRPGLGRTA